MKDLVTFIVVCFLFALFIFVTAVIFCQPADLCRPKDDKEKKSKNVSDLIKVQSDKIDDVQESLKNLSDQNDAILEKIQNLEYLLEEMNKQEKSPGWWSA